jgi:hypothetical protein
MTGTDNFHLHDVYIRHRGRARWPFCALVRCPRRTHRGYSLTARHSDRRRLVFVQTRRSQVIGTSLPQSQSQNPNKIDVTKILTGSYTRAHNGPWHLHRHVVLRLHPHSSYIRSQTTVRRYWFTSIKSIKFEVKACLP